MSVDPTTVAQLAADTGTAPATLEKVIRLGELLEDVGRHDLLRGRLALKGGTALNLSFTYPPRLSVDLDFNYVGSADREVMRRERPLVEQALEGLARARAYLTQWSGEQHAGRTAYLSYRNYAGVNDRVELDVNFLFRTPLAPTVRRSLWQPAGVARLSTVTVADEELAIGKLCATLARGLPRDLFDVPHLPLLLGERWSTLGFRHLFVAVAGLLDRPLHAYDSRRLDRVDDAAVRAQLAPILIGADIPSAAALRDGAWRVLAPLLELDAASREYTDRLQRGELVPELLFPDDAELAARLAAHPVLRWKQQNAAGGRAQTAVR